MALFERRRIRPAGDGFDLNLPIAERELLGSLPGQLVELLDASADNLEDPAVARLFPDAYSAADSDLAAEYRRLMTDDLRERHRVALETLATGSHAEHVTAEDLYAWMTALTQLRLVIGTRIGVTEDWGPDEDDPSAGVYSYLSWLQEQVVEALSSRM
ncbi:MAG TPA: DUF2017 family protein [Acidimicrobiales bacterium]|nr:DUF2017 family protein [Acidimicrobiales bacterium]